MQEEREREEEERLLELKDEEYDLLDEDSLQVNQAYRGTFHICLHLFHLAFRSCRTSK